MDKIHYSQLQNTPFQGKTVFMVHLKQDKQYWESVLPATIKVRTSHSLGFWAIRRAYRINSNSVSQLKVSYLLDSLIPDEPDTDSQRKRLLELLNALLQRSANPETQPATDEPSTSDGLASGSHGSQPGYRDVVITLSTLAKKEACLPHDLQAIDAVLEMFTPYYHVFRTKLGKLDRKEVVAYAKQTLDLSLPKEGVLKEYDFADQIWLPAIFEQVPLEAIDNLLIEDKPGFYRAERNMVERWDRSGTRVIEVIPKMPQNAI
jgi:hypothetical protein